MSEFDKWYKEKYYKYDLYPKYAQFRKEMEEVWQAATAESDKCVRELTATIAELEASNELLHEALESNQISEKELLSYRNHINVLRENLDYAYYEVNTHFAKNIKELLASTPAQSLIQHDNEVIERVVTLLKDSAWDDGIIDMRVNDLIEDVRKLKGTA